MILEQIRLGPLDNFVYLIGDHATATGAVNGGGPRMVLENEHGTIEIRKGTASGRAENSERPERPEKPEPPEPTEN